MNLQIIFNPMNLIIDQYFNIDYATGAIPLNQLHLAL